MQELWNAKYNREDLLYGEKPNEFVKQSYRLLKKGSTVICLGEGEGRNAIFLAENGFNVEALDSSDVGLHKLRQKLEEKSLNIMIRHTMMENWMPQYEYDGIFSIYFHIKEENRNGFFEKILNSLKKGGFFISEVFSKKQLNYNSGGSKDINLLYDLSTEYKRLSSIPFKIILLSEEIVTLNEGIGHQGEACIMRMILQKN